MFYSFGTSTLFLVFTQTIIQGLVSLTFLSISSSLIYFFFILSLIRHRPWRAEHRIAAALRALVGPAIYGATIHCKHSRRNAVLCPPIAERSNRGIAIDKMIKGCKPEGFAPAARRTPPIADSSNKGKMLTVRN
jgi:hypothetical protein